MDEDLQLLVDRWVNGQKQFVREHLRFLDPLAAGALAVRIAEALSAWHGEGEGASTRERFAAELEAGA